MEKNIYKEKEREIENESLSAQELEQRDLRKNEQAGTPDREYDEDFNEELAADKEDDRVPGGNEGYGGSKTVTGADDHVQVSGKDPESFGTSSGDNGEAGDMSQRGRGQSFGYGDKGYTAGGFLGDKGNRLGGQTTHSDGGDATDEQGIQPPSGKSGNNARGESAGFDSGGYEKGESDGGVSE